MCGITGILDFNKLSKIDDLIGMTNALMHRGPDDCGYFVEESDHAFLGLGHRRLSVIDLTSEAHQPMSFKDSCIIFNGEVYNFKEVRLELEAAGYSFFSESDTEVVLKALDKWGTRALDKFNGMFAIAYYEKRSDKLFLIRDRAGVKPLFWYFKDGLLLFSSELKSFHRHPGFKKQLNFDSLATFLQFGYVPQPDSIFCDVRKLQSGHFLEIDLKTKHFSEKKYWDVFELYSSPQLSISEDEALEETVNLMRSAFKYRMVSDVPVGLFLSGGYDSSAVAALLQNAMDSRLNTFTIGFSEKEFDEAPFAKKVATYLGTNHFEHYCQPKEALEIIPSLPQIYDEPFGDSSSIPTILVSRFARQKVTVCLSADGGDELFGGYSRYQAILERARILGKMPQNFRRLISKILETVNPSSVPFLNRQFNFQTRYENLKSYVKETNCLDWLRTSETTFPLKDIQNLLKIPVSLPFTCFEKAKSLDLGDCLRKMLAVSYKSYQLDDILVKVDRGTMSASLEGREPFLDYRLIEFISKLPSSLKIRGREKKYLLKKIVHKFIPSELMERKKMGFGVPIETWLKNDLKELLLDFLNLDKIRREGIFEAEIVKNLLEQYLEGRGGSSQKLWYLLTFQMWKERWC